MYFQPIFCSGLHGDASVEFKQENLGRITMQSHQKETPNTAIYSQIPTIAESTEPRLKNTDNAVRRYCFPFGICSSNRVPSVGMEPLGDAGRVNAKKTEL